MVFELISSNGKKMHCLSLLGSYGERNQAKGPSRLSRWELCFPAWWFTLNTSKRTQEWLGVKQGGILHGQRICGLHKAPALVLQITVFFLCWCWSLFRINMIMPQHRRAASLEIFMLIETQFWTTATLPVLLIECKLHRLIHSLYLPIMNDSINVPSTKHQNAHTEIYTN